MVFPIFGMLSMALTASAAAMNTAGAANAPRPMTGKDISRKYDERIRQGTNAAQDAGMASSLSLARSGSGTGGGRASSLRAAMMQAPEIQARATEAGFNAGANVAGGEVQASQIAHGQTTERYHRPFEEATRGLGAAATGFSDMETGQMMTGNRYQTSDVHSKTEIKRLTDENAVLNYALETARGVEQDLMAGRPTAKMRNERQAAAMKQGTQVAGMRKPAEASTPATTAPAPAPAAQGPQPVYRSDDYWLQNYDPDLLQEIRKTEPSPATMENIAKIGGPYPEDVPKQKATTRQKRVLSKGKK